MIYLITLPEDGTAPSIYEFNDARPDNPFAILAECYARLERGDRLEADPDVCAMLGRMLAGLPVVETEPAPAA